MHRTSIYLFAGAILAFSAGATIAAEASDLPLRKAGRWEQKTTMEEGGKKHEQTLTICIDADMERNTALASDAEHKKSCSKYEVKKSGDTVVVEFDVQHEPARRRKPHRDEWGLSERVQREDRQHDFGDLGLADRVDQARDRAAGQVCGRILRRP